MEETDVDGNGEIDFDEFLAMMAKQLKGHSGGENLRVSHWCCIVCSLSQVDGNISN